jgi:hypothetical protein
MPILSPSMPSALMSKKSAAKILKPEFTNNFYSVIVDL